MAVTYQASESNNQAQTKWEPIDLGPHGSFEIEVRRPTWSELTVDGECPVGYLEARLENHIVGWRGVETEDGEPVPYSFENFQRFCSKVPMVFQKASRIVSALFAALPDDTKKNSVDPSNESSTDTTTDGVAKSPITSN